MAAAATSGGRPVPAQGSSLKIPRAAPKGRNLVKQRELFGQSPTPAVACGVSRYTLRRKPSKSPEGAVARGDFISIVLSQNG